MPPRKQPAKAHYPPIADYALIGDCHSAALISKDASIDWCCMPRYDSGSVFGRILDWERGGYCAITPGGRGVDVSRRYVDRTMVLETTFRTGGGEARLFDCFCMRRGGRLEPYREILRIVEGVRGRVDFSLAICPRFDYGGVRPWIRQQGVNFFSVIGGNDGLLVASDVDLQPGGHHDLNARFTVRAGERVHLSIKAEAPERIDDDPPEPPTPEHMDRRLDETLRWWRRWASRGTMTGPDDEGVIRSAIVLKALINAPTGAMAAAPTTSLPEALGGSRNWDYRYSWIRDSSFAVRSLAELGYQSEADGFRRFVERSAAGNAHDLQLMYGVGGERRLNEQELPTLEGYRRAAPVRIGNGAAAQFQLDLYGELLDLAWRWHQRGYSPDDDYWRFIVETVNQCAGQWKEPDSGIWEVRGPRKHFVHSKVMSWVAMDRGIRLAQESRRAGPIRKWQRLRTEIRRSVERNGYDSKRGVFVQAYGSKALDSALLLLPTTEFVDWEDERMVRTTDAIRDKLSRDGLLWRYRGRDGLGGQEGAFLACAFWLAENYAHQGRYDEAREIFDRTVSTGNDLGLFSEEFDPETNEMLGNFPMGLSHLSHVTAAVALERVGTGAS
jgi:GH15 family glucan-1,4-alpha-glucosidase